MMLGAVDVSAADAGSAPSDEQYDEQHNGYGEYRDEYRNGDRNRERGAYPDDGDRANALFDEQGYGERRNGDRNADSNDSRPDARYDGPNGSDRTHGNSDEGYRSPWPPLSMPDPGLNGSAFQWREEKPAPNGNGTSSPLGHEIGRTEPPSRQAGWGERPDSGDQTLSNGTGESQEVGWKPPTIPPPRDGGRPEIRSGGPVDSAPRSPLAPDFTSTMRPMTGSPASQSGNGPVGYGEPRVSGAGDRYEQFAAQQSLQRNTPAEPPSVQAPPAETAKWDWQDFSQPSQPPPGQATSSVNFGAMPGDGPYVNVMSVPGGGKKRSTLLPRMTNVDANAVNQEIATLHAELMRLLPNGHEAGERARHLLEKAHDILQSDPMREAEVEYYMQQVRAIAQRVQQTRQWSDLYRDRLRLYLAAWTLLSLIVVTARLMFPIDVEAFLLGLTGGAAGSALIAHYLGGLMATFAGSLGGSLGALATMVQHARREYGFFDRKYGLRGLMLPIIGWLFGALLYLVAALLFSLMGIVPAENPIAASIPAVGAFIFGVSQESIYGTRS